MNLPEHLQAIARAEYEKYLAAKAELEAEKRENEERETAEKAKFKQAAIEAIGPVMELFEVGTEDGNFLILQYGDAGFYVDRIGESGAWKWRIYKNFHRYPIATTPDLNIADFAWEIWAGIFDYESRQSPDRPQPAEPKEPVSRADDPAFPTNVDSDGEGLSKFEYFFARILQGELASGLGIPMADDAKRETIREAIALARLAIDELDDRK
jgi:hypothetical protein